MTAIVLVGCGSSTAGRTTATIPDVGTSPEPHPQAIAPDAGGGAANAPAVQQQHRHQGPDPVPVAPASNISHPAAGAPTDAEVRAAIAKFQLAIATYHLNQLDLSKALIDPRLLPPGVFNVSIASVFTDYGRPVACGGVEQVPELGVAHKTLPCGTMVIFRYGSRAIRVPVIDRGPYIPGREWDLTGAAAVALGFPGLGPIEWRLG
jgi:hypothetical protein